MAWNRPIEDGRVDSTEPSWRDHRIRPTVRGAIAGAVVVVSAGIALWLTITQVGEERLPKQAKIRPAITDFAQPSKSPAHGVSVPGISIAGEVTKNSIQKPDTHTLGAVSKTYPGRHIHWISHEKPVFTNRFESFVSGLLTARPGTRIFEVQFDKSYDDAFKESLKNRQVISPDDPEEIAALKTAVEESKAGVAKLMNEGMTPREILKAALDEFNEVAGYREELERNVKTLLTQSTDPELVRTYVKEANRELEKYDAAPISIPEDDEELVEHMIYQRDNTQRLERRLEEEKAKKESR